ncbi:MAG: 50S ribosomal protein L33 [Candidatus Pacebacteria bacterium]|nr:50S ribosomal protein L33 [Candidatus Paceibacterota bacterium]
MSQDRLQKMRSATGSIVFTRKNKKKVERKLELKKYDPITRKREVFKEVKK